MAAAVGGFYGHYVLELAKEERDAQVSNVREKILRYVAANPDDLNSQLTGDCKLHIFRFLRITN